LGDGDRGQRLPHAGMTRGDPAAEVAQDHPQVALEEALPRDPPRQRRG